MKTTRGALPLGNGGGSFGKGKPCVVGVVVRKSAFAKTGRHAFGYQRFLGVRRCIRPSIAWMKRPIPGNLREAILISGGSEDGSSADSVLLSDKTYIANA